MGSLGIVTIFAHVTAEATDSKIPVILPVQVDAVDSDAPMLISHESLCKMKGSIAFESRTLKIPNIGSIKLYHTKSGHLAIQGARPTKNLSDSLSQRGHAVYMAQMELPARVPSMGDVAKIRAPMGLCSENTLLTTIREAQTHFDLPAIREMLTKFGCQTTVRRITLPSVEIWMTKYNGEIIAMGIISPFADCFGERIAKDYPALFMIDSLSRFINCSWLIARASEHAGRIFMDDCVRPLGKPRRIISDKGGPTLAGKIWTDVSHTFGRQMIRAPAFTPNQNVLAERSTRLLEIAVKNIISGTKAICPSREISTDR